MELNDLKKKAVKMMYDILDQKLEKSWFFLNLKLWKIEQILFDENSSYIIIVMWPILLTPNKNRSECK